MSNSLLQGIYKNDHLSISKAITIIENNLTFHNNLFEDLDLNNKSLRIGITGPPGAGKSTLTNQLIETILFNKKTVGVVAVDPTSPFSGGSLLGDRVRMNKYMWDDRVFIRSMASHGDLGGLARKSLMSRKIGSGGRGRCQAAKTYVNKGNFHKFRVDSGGV